MPNPMENRWLYLLGKGSGFEEFFLELYFRHFIDFSFHSEFISVWSSFGKQSKHNNKIIDE